MGSASRKESALSPTDGVRFAQAFNRLAVATRLNEKEADASMQRIYFDGLRGLSVEAVEQAAHEIALSAEWFPKLAEWRAKAKIAQGVHDMKALPPARENPWEDECGACQDTGWEARTCYGGTRNTCGRKRCEGEGMPEHTYATPCSCRATNHTYQRHHADPRKRQATGA